MLGINYESKINTMMPMMNESREDYKLLSKQ